MKKFAALFLTLCMVLPLVACGGEKDTSTPSGDTTAEVTYDGVIKVGAVGPLTGAAAESGIACQQGQELAVAEWNANGGIEIDGKHYQIELLYEDSAGAPETAVAAAEKLLGVDKVDVLFGETLISSCILAVMDLAPKYPDVVFSSIEGQALSIPEKYATDPEKYYNFFKPCWSADSYGGICVNSVQYLVDAGVASADNKSVAFVLEDTDYGRSICDAAVAAFEDAGWSIAAYEVSPQGTTDFYSQINKLMSLEPDVVISCFVPEASGVAYVKQVEELGAEWTDIGIDYPTKPNFCEDAGSACAGLIWAPVEVDYNSEPLLDFAAKIEDMHGVSVTKCQVSGYDVTNMMFEAIEKAGTWKASEGLAETFASTPYEGLCGKFVINDRHYAMAGDGYLNLALAQIQEDATTSLLVYPDNMKQADAFPQH